MSALSTHPARRRREAPMPMLRLPRALWLVVGVGAAAGAVACTSAWILAAWIAPDLAFLAAGTDAFRGGSMSARGIRAYNAGHVLAGPLVMLAASMFVPALTGVGLIWLSYVAIDRALGYTPRGADGEPRRV